MAKSDELVVFKAKLHAREKIKANLYQESKMKAQLTVPPQIVSSDYEDLENKPKINDVTVLGNKTFEEYGLFSLSNMEILETFNKIFK